MKRKLETIAPEFAQAVVEAHDIENTMADREEREDLQRNNSGLYYAYLRLLQIAYPTDGRWYP